MYPYPTIKVVYEDGSKQRQTMLDTSLDPRSRPSDLGPQILRILTQILRSRSSDPEIETPDPEIQTLDPKILTHFRPLFGGPELLAPNHLTCLNPTTRCVVYKGPQAHNQSLVTLRALEAQYLISP